MLVGEYTYSHAYGVGEGESNYSWEIGGTVISSEVSYTPTVYDSGKTIVFNVTPVSADGIKGKTESTSIIIATYVPSGGVSGGSSSGSSYFSSNTKDSSVKPGKSDQNSDVTIPENFEGFSDTKQHWANENIIAMYKKGIAMGDGNNFYPDNKLTRAEAAAFIARTIGVENQKPKENAFLDVEPSEWYYNSIGLLYELEIMNGVDGYANPNVYISREELTCLVIRALEYKIGKVDILKGSFFFDEEKISSWAQESINKASGLKLVEGTNANFLPKNTATRAETITILKRLVDYIESNKKTGE